MWRMGGCLETLTRSSDWACPKDWAGPKDEACRQVVRRSIQPLGGIFLLRQKLPGFNEFSMFNVFT
jgi:hypothetical protein